VRALLLALLLAGEASASRVFFRKLEEVLTPATPVVVARLATRRVERPPGQYQVFLTLSDVESLNGALPEPGELLHSFSTDMERNGMRISPIRDGSGLETSLQVGQRYCFLLDSSRRFVVRVEPAEAAGRIRKLLQASS